MDNTEDSTEEDLDDIIENSRNTLGIVHVSEGDLVFLPEDMEEEAAKVIQDIELTSGHETGDSESDIDVMDVDENSGTKN